ncbi:DUF6286 domain-containing protein [Actinomycetaceae bacterium L2_0104]
MSNLRRRPTRTIPSLLACIVILLLAGGLMWAAVTRLSSGQWPEAVTSASESVASTAANSTESWIAASIVLFLGLLLLLCAWIPGQPNAAPLRVEAASSDLVNGQTEAVMTNRGLANLASSAAEQVDGVTSIKTTANASRVNVRVVTPLHSTGSLTQSVKDAVTKRLESAELARRPAVSVSATTQEAL